MVHSDALPDKTAGLVLLLLLFFNSLFFSFSSGPFVLEAAAHFGRHRKCFLNAHYDSRDVVYHFDTLVGLVNDFCVCVCVPIFLFYFFRLCSTVFPLQLWKRKKTTKTWPLKKEKKMMVVAAVVMWKRGWNCTSWGFCAFDGYDQIGGGHLLFIPLSRRAIRTSRFPSQPPCIHEPANARRRSERSTVHSLSNQLTVQCMHLKCIT